jgi:hypothetical protein
LGDPVEFKADFFNFRLVGFEELGNNDAFSTATLELRLAQSSKFDNCFADKDVHSISYLHRGASKAQ